MAFREEKPTGLSARSLQLSVNWRFPPKMQIV
jgi:hypothetical protein